MPSGMNRRDFVRMLGAGAAALAVPRWAAAQDAPRTNVLFIAVDDLRPQLGCYGHRQMISPHIDRLAGQGVAFQYAYCQQAVCAPSRASLMTGLRPDSTTIYDLHTPVRKALPDVLTLPQHFKNNGYTSQSLGKIYHHRNDDKPGWSTAAWHARVPGYALPRNRALDRYQSRVTAHKTWRDRGAPAEAADVPDDGYPDGATTNHAIDLLDGYGDSPFFLAVGYYKPHLPFNAPQRYWDLYDPADIDLADNPFQPKDCPDVAMHTWGELRSYSDIPPVGPVTDAKALEWADYAVTDSMGRMPTGAKRTTMVARVARERVDELNRRGFASARRVLVGRGRCLPGEFDSSCHRGRGCRALDRARRAGGRSTLDRPGR